MDDKIETKIDYSNTIIYKISCKDPSVKDLYVGHTVNFSQRKKNHQYTCNNKSINYKCKLYDTINKNGGWNNWNMEIIYFFRCANLEEARKKEQEYYELLGANLNSVEPFPTRKNKPEPKLEPNQSIVNVDNKYQAALYFCEECKFKTGNKKDFKRHESTSKHKKNIHNVEIYCEKSHHKTCFKCSCGKEYKHKTSLCKHKKMCNDIITSSVEKSVTCDSTEEIQGKNQYLIIQLLKENNELLRNLFTNKNKTTDSIVKEEFVL